MNIYESGEDYLEVIFRLKKLNGVVKSVDIVNHLSYAKSSVSRAVNSLKAKLLITIDKDGFIELTKAGLDYATDIFERHTVITNFLIAIGVDEHTADHDACKMEHIISNQTFNVMKNYKSNNCK